MPEDLYDLIIIGGGPAGLTAGLYARRALLKTLLLEKGPLGGQVIYTDLIENYPGFPEGISGFDLIDLMHKQVQKVNLEILEEEVIALSDFETYKELTTATGKKFRSRAVILALGAMYKKLGVPGELEFTGKGVSYCAICDGPFYRGEVVAVVGGGNTALQEALHLTKYAEKVYLIHRRDAFRATAILQERVKANPKIELILNSVPEEIQGRDKVETLRLKNVKTGETFILPVAGIFIFIGLTASTQWLKGILDLDEQGFIITDKEMRTSLSGVFACGDCVSKKFRQIINACGEGAVAALNAEEFIKSLVE
ncbi:thioredoxin reductase [Caldimicrobium thiodismutans]|uniref:Thioredoxin reductase n=1 Tax=Caldimicrobium thiodismutans TaxID=1653476 RepID=A0A0U5ARV6_9BACT|nr:thioredoxin-disulfide reductase [Caldimicrobium thiodismutans]BAU23649.1 thioredoxin reductase [Caldimicrobium thiodismutans]